MKLENAFIYVYGEFNIDKDNKSVIYGSRNGDCICNDDLNNKNQRYVLFYGYNLNKNSIKSELLKCYYEKPYLPLLTIETLNEENKKEAVKLYGYKHMKQGYFFIGNHYVGPLGENYQEHPFLKDVLEEYIKNKNEEINIYNNSL